MLGEMRLSWDVEKTPGPIIEKTSPVPTILRRSRPSDFAYLATTAVFAKSENSVMRLARKFSGPHCRVLCLKLIRPSDAADESWGNCELEVRSTIRIEHKWTPSTTSTIR